MTSPQGGEPHLSRGERALVDEALRVLGERPVDPVRRLTGGRSGALVVSLGATLVLKVTTAHEQLLRAAVELDVVADVHVQRRQLAPAYSAGACADGAVYLLSGRCAALPPAASFDGGRWADIGRRLGEVHQTPVPRTAGRQAKPGLTDDVLASAVECWGQRGHGSTAGRAADVVASLPRASLDRGLVLTHGDCHLDNLVVDGTGLLRWVDWQGAHLGNGFHDLMFLCQRAEFTGVGVWRESLLTSYAQQRDLRPGEAFDRACWTAELTSLLVAWPPFLSYGTPERQAMMAARLLWLSDALGPAGR